ncbi:TPA: hypothetical protein VC078_000108 [Streptococcus pyogenes]|nr:hypothetical protein [Streptococcus pyogenes]
MVNQIKTFIQDLFSLMKNGHPMINLLLMLMMGLVFYSQLKVIQHRKQDYLDGNQLGRFDDPLLNYKFDVFMSIVGIVLSATLGAIYLSILLFYLS